MKGAWLAVGLTVLLAHCKPASEPTPAPPSPEDEARELIRQGQPDQALERLATLPANPTTWLLQGEAWARKAETAPLPTPPPPEPGSRAMPPAPEFKPEELQAVRLLEQAIAGNPQLAEAHLALAKLLSPHALRRFQAESQVKGRRRGGPAPPVSDAGEPDYGPARILREFGAAGRSSDATLPEIRAWIAFAEQVAQLGEAEAGYQELVKRDHESAEPLIAYGDFLTRMLKDPQRAVEIYQQALIWTPQDASIKGRLADIYLDLGYENFKRREYGAAQVRFDAARKYAPDGSTPQGQRLLEYQDALREIRQSGGR